MDTHANDVITIVSKSGLFRNGLKSLLSDSSFSIVDEIQAIEQIDEGGGGIVLVDAGTSPARLIEDIRYLTRVSPNRPVVVLADILEWSSLVSTIGAGASGYLLKDISTEALVGSLDLVRMGEKVFPTDMSSLLLRGSRPAPPMLDGGGPLPHLSQRENEILRHLVDGDSNKVIARRLDVTEATVKVHMKSLMRKLKCANRTQAAVWALNHGFSEQGGPDEPEAEADTEPRGRPDRTSGGRRSTLFEDRQAVH